MPVHRNGSLQQEQEGEWEANYIVHYLTNVAIWSTLKLKKSFLNLKILIQIQLNLQISADARKFDSPDIKMAVHVWQE